MIPYGTLSTTKTGLRQAFYSKFRFFPTNPFLFLRILGNNLLVLWTWRGRVVDPLDALRFSTKHAHWNTLWEDYFRWRFRLRHLLFGKSPTRLGDETSEIIRTKSLNLERKSNIEISNYYLLINNVRREDEGTYKIEYSLELDGTVLADHEVNVTVLGKVQVKQMSSSHREEYFFVR